MRTAVDGGPKPRVFFDTTFTRTQAGNVGITRTVRHLGAELASAVAPDAEFAPVAFHSTGYRRVSAEDAWPRDRQAAGRASDSMPARLLRALSESELRRLVARWGPVPLVYLVWRAYNRVIYDRLAKQASPVRFRAGDVLLLCDASWANRSWGAVAKARAQGATVVVMIHDLFPLTFPQFSTALVSRVFGNWLREILPVSDAVICNSRATETELRAYAMREGRALPPTGHFRLGADLVPARGAAPVRAHIASFLREGVPCFSIVGTVEPRKNHAWALRAFEALWAAGHEVRLLVAGRFNAEGHALVRAMEAHPEQGRRLLTVTDASDGEVAALYAESRALLFPSLAEGFGLPLVEARTRGCPVIAGDLPVFEELADGGVFLYPRAAMAKMQELVLQHAATDFRLRVGAMPAFTWADSARQFLGVVDALLPGAVAPREAGAPASDPAF